MSVFQPSFSEVSRAQSKASIVIEGLSGKGKSGLALIMGYVLAGANWSEVFALDTENRSLNLFEGLSSHLGIPFGKFRKFDLTKMHGYSPLHYVASKDAAKRNGAKVFIQDSITHAWQGHGGVLQMVAKAEAASTKTNKFNAWGTEEVMQNRDAIYEMIRDPDVHVISCVRVKEKFELVTGEGIKSLGEQQVMMPDLKYEPDLVLHMLEAGTVSGKPPKVKIIKSRYAVFAEGEVYDMTLERLEELRDYLAEGVDPAILLEQQRMEYVQEVKYILDSSPTKSTMWGILKSQHGVTDTPLEEIPLPVLRKLLSALLV